MNNEPVAWMVDSVITYSDDIAQGLSAESGKPIIPLYTRPSEHDLGIAEAIGFDKGYKAATAKTLTDEEIEEFEWVIKKHFHFNPNEKVVGLDRIIREILKKASER